MCGCASFLLTSHNALFCISLTHTHTHTYAHTNCLYVSIHPSLTLSSHPALCRVAPTQNGVAAHISTPEPLGSRLEAAEAALEEVREKIAALQAVEVKLAREAATLAAEQSEEQPRESSGMAVPSMIRTETVDDDALAVHDMVMAQRRERELYGRSNDDNDNDDDDDDGGGGGGGATTCHVDVRLAGLDCLKSLGLDATQPGSLSLDRIDPDSLEFVTRRLLSLSSTLGDWQRFQCWCVCTCLCVRVCACV